MGTRGEHGEAEAEAAPGSYCHAGNHETDNMNQIYGFEGEVKAKYTAQMYELFSEVFEWLPLAQCINGKVLVRPRARPDRWGGGTGPPLTMSPAPQIMHGGLFSEDGVTLDDIRKIERNRQPPDSGGAQPCGRSTGEDGAGADRLLLGPVCLIPGVPGALGSGTPFPGCDPGLRGQAEHAFPLFLQGPCVTYSGLTHSHR